VCGLIQQTTKLSSNERIFVCVNETWLFYDTFSNQQISKSSSSSSSPSRSSSSS